MGQLKGGGEVVQKCLKSFMDGPFEVCVVLSQNSVFTFSQSTPIAAAVMVAFRLGHSHMTFPGFYSCVVAYLPR